ncbi:hypothetical protein JCM11491_003970 [Sporobolomyces phaffii]
MSLYGGIKLSGSKLPAAASSAPPAAPTGKVDPPATADQDKPRPSNWSAALRFAPVQRKKPGAASAATASRPLATAFSTALDDDDDPVTAPSGSGGAPRIAKVGKASLNVEPIKRPPPSKWGAGSSMAAQEAILLEAKAKAAAAAAADAASASASASHSSNSAATPRRTGAPTRIRRVIPIPPSMTLEDELILPTPSAAGTDVNGFASTAMGLKLAKEQEKKNNKRGKKRKGQGGGGAAEDPALRYGEIPYDPARPCDYAGYKTHVKLARAQRRLEREEEERQRRRREGSAGSGSSYYSEDDEDDRDDHRDEPSKRARFFAPPTSYDDQGLSFPPSMNPEATPYIPAPSLAAPAREETADEAYARRVALSNPAPPSREETGDEAYQRRIAMPQRPPPASFGRQEEPGTRRGIGGSHPSSAIQSPAPPSFITSSFVPPTSFVPPSAAPSSLPPSIPPPPPGFMPPPSFASPAHPHQLSIPPPSIPTPAAATVSDEPPSAVDAAAARAREIAARLSKLGGAFASGPPPPAAQPAPPTPSSSYPTFQPAQAPAAEPSELDHRPFAERMMSKYGWSSGKGLGASESGMTTALSVTRPAAAAPKLSRALRKKQKHFGTAAASAEPVVGMASRNTVVDASRAGRADERTREMGGDPSRVVLLENVCGPHEVDDDLPGEIADEANKLGVVERCAVVVVPLDDDDVADGGADPGEREEVRVFLVMSGLAGAYNAVRSFEGRFFGGRTVRARYYDEEAFKSGDHYL